MKKCAIITLALLILIGLIGCSTEKRDNYNAALQSASEGDYENAIELLSAFPEYKNSEEKLVEYKYQLALQLLGMSEDSDSSTDDFGLPTSSKKDDRQKAYDLLKEIGEYQDSVSLCEKLEQRQAYDAACEKYDKAVASFSEGKFIYAREIFRELDASQFDDLQKYLDGMDAMEAVMGEWEGTHSGSGFTVVSCTIGAPFRIGKSEYSDCDWAVTASVTLSVSKYFGGSFIITKQVGFEHSIKNNSLGDHILLFGEPYQFVFEPDRGVYPLIYLQKEDTGKILLMEIPQASNGSVYTYDGKSMELEKK